MQWTLSHLADNNIIYIKTQGEVTLDEIIKLSKEAKNLTKKHKSTKILCDHLNAVSKLQVLDIYNRSQAFENEEFPRIIKMAHVIPESEYADFRFFETLSQNKGFLIRMFSKKNSALDWLMNGKLKK